MDLDFCRVVGDQSTAHVKLCNRLEVALCSLYGGGGGSHYDEMENFLHYWPFVKVTSWFSSQMASNADLWCFTSWKPYKL